MKKLDWVNINICGPAPVIGEIYDELEVNHRYGLNAGDYRNELTLEDVGVAYSDGDHDFNIYLDWNPETNIKPLVDLISGESGEYPGAKIRMHYHSLSERGVHHKIESEFQNGGIVWSKDGMNGEYGAGFYDEIYFEEGSDNSYDLEA